MRDVHICQKCGFVSTLRSEFVCYGDSEFCIDCVCDDGLESANEEGEVIDETN